jgi:hypothetical protein
MVCIRLNDGTSPVSTKENKMPKRRKNDMAKPASECPKCGTWRTPGQEHFKKDTKAVPKTKGKKCNG